MYCTHCGKEIEDTWVKCPYCGADIGNGNQEEDNNFHPEENNGTKKEKKHILGKILGAALLIRFV